jgi:hypothetical protein
MKVVINKAIGGYDLSNQCIDLMIERGYDVQHYGDVCKNDRSNEILISILEEKGSEWCSGIFSKLCIVEIPDDVDWYVGECEDGVEYVAERHRIWWGD